MKRIIAVIFCTLSLVGAYAQKSKQKSIHATYKYYYDDNMSANEARTEALRLAKVKALADEFGTVISVTTNDYTETTENNTHNRFTDISMTETRGVWIKDTQSPVILRGYDDNSGMSWFNVEVWGIAREINNKQADIDVKLLRNRPYDDAESDTFTEGDRLYISVQTPIKGYLAVYCLDIKNRKAYRNIPSFENESIRPVEIKPRVRHVFLNTDQDATVMTCDDDRVEYDRIIVLFSPNYFSLPNDDMLGEAMTEEELSSIGFLKNTTYNWSDAVHQGNLDRVIAKLRASDEEFVCKHIDISVKSNRK